MSATDGRGPLVDREISWLAFGDRVLQEAADPSVPLLDRLFFCGVFSSNLDEYFRVRVASLRSLVRTRAWERKVLDFNPPRLLHDIHRIVLAQQERYGTILTEVLRGLAAEGIHLVDDQSAPPEDGPWLERYFRDVVLPHVEPVFLSPPDGSRPFLRNRVVYLVVEVWPGADERIDAPAPSYALVRVPSPPLPRFVRLPDERSTVMFLDDVIRRNLPALFPGREVQRAYAVKLTRDADLRIEDEFDGDVVDAIRTGLARRETGVPSRFLYDMRAPYALVHALQHGLGLAEDDIVLGGRYHNLSDLVDFPRFGRTDLAYPDPPPVPHAHLTGPDPIFDGLAEADRVVHTPYQSFEPVIRFLDEAARDPYVEEVWLTVYRVARDSEVLRALLAAADAGKRVTVFIEAQARFDEESNLDWGGRLEAAGARTLYPLPGLKVHAKMALVARRERGERKLYGYVGTGNLNEKTSRVYADHGVLTADARVTRDVEQVFRFLAGEVKRPATRHLLVAPFDLREGFYALIDAETEAALAGRPSGMVLKMNALEDPGIIERLYAASRAGVPIDLVVRGICRLVPAVPGSSETIAVRSILDRYLEHARLYRFHAGGAARLYLSSADWMRRNLNRRVEVALPVHDAEVRRQLEASLELQLADDRKARRIDEGGRNPYVPHGPEPGVRSQEAFRDFLAGLARDPA